MKHNDEVLFRNITADEKTKELIRKWMANAEIKSSCFTEVLESTDIMKSPFHFTLDSYTTTVLKIMCMADKGEYYILLYFWDTDSLPEMAIVDCTDEHTKWYEYSIKEGELHSYSY